jgi:hypothetical protein
MGVAARSVLKVKNKYWDKKSCGQNACDEKGDCARKAEAQKHALNERNLIISICQ